MSDELKPCPFCGSHDIKDDVYKRDGREVVCRECHARVGEFNPDANAKAIAAWNRRVPAIGEGSRVEGLEWEDAKDRGYSQANCALGQYQVSWLGEFEVWQCCRPHRSGLEWKDNFSRHASKDEAKAAAQADYEQRIRSALA